MGKTNYKQARIVADDGSRRVTVELHISDNAGTLLPFEFREMRAKLLDRVMQALPGRNFNPNLSDMQVKKNVR